MNFQTAQGIIVRITALFFTSALGIVTGAAIIAPELEIYKSAILAGFSSVAAVVQKIAQSSIDGKLTSEEIDEAFGVKRKGPEA